MFFLDRLHEIKHLSTSILKLTFSKLPLTTRFKDDECLYMNTVNKLYTQVKWIVCNLTAGGPSSILCSLALAHAFLYLSNVTDQITVTFFSYEISIIDI